MRQFNTSLLLRRQPLAGDFQTHPYEAAWASEAIFFIRLERLAGQAAEVTARAQISPDGLHWVDEGTAFAPMAAPGLYFVRVRHFGGWLRLEGRVAGQATDCEATIYIVLKA